MSVLAAQLGIWFIVTLEVILSLYVLLLHIRHPVHQHVGVLLMSYAITGAGIGWMMTATDVAQAQTATWLISGTAIAVQAGAILATVALIKPGWLYGRQRWVWWPVYALMVLPAALTALDVLRGTQLWYVSLVPETYQGGFVLSSAYLTGPVSTAVRVAMMIAMPAALLVLLYLLLFDKSLSPLNRRLGWVLLVAQSLAAAAALIAPRQVPAVVLALFTNLAISVPFVYVTWRQMLVERRPQVGSLQVRLTVLILAIVVPLFIAILAINNFRISFLLREKFEQDLVRANEQLVTRTQEWLNDHVGFLEAVASLTAITSMQADLQKPLLEELIKQYPYMYLISTVGMDGINVARSDLELPKDYRDRLWFQQARDGAPMAFQVLISRTSGRPSLVMSKPIRNRSGQIVGVLMFGSELNQLVREVSLSRIGAAGYAYLVDADNVLVAHPEAGVAQELRNLSDEPAVKVLRQGQRGIYSFQDADGRQWVACLDAMEHGWGVIVQQPLDELVILQRPLQQTSWVMVGFALVVLLILAWFSVRQAFIPLRSLTYAAHMIAAGDLTHPVPVESQDEIGVLARTLNDMTTRLNGLIGGLEQSVRERTAALERRSVYLEGSAEIAQAAASIIDRDELQARVVELIRQRFNLYYVGLFLLDSAREWAVLQAGTGTAGRLMRARGHRLKVGEGMVGWAIANAQARIALRAEQDQARRVIVELPDTRSEAALPLRARGQVIGAITVQSDQSDAFDQDALMVLQTMADQVALAIDNARLLAESAESLRVAQRAAGELTGQAWSELLHARGEWGYRYADRAMAAATGDWQPDLRQAVQTDSVVQYSPPSDSMVPDQASRLLSIPLRVREQVVGALRFRRSTPDQAWTRVEIELLEALVNQLGQALEVARLYEDTQRLAAREQVISDISEAFTRAIDQDALLRAAVRELSRLPNVTQVSVHIGAEPEQAD